MSIQKQQKVLIGLLEEKIKILELHNSILKRDNESLYRQMQAHLFSPIYPGMFVK
jgi:hypothetical protein